MRKYHYTRMTKKEVEEKIINKVRFQAENYFWKGTQLYSKVKGRFGLYEIEIEEPTTVTYNGDLVEIVE